MALHFTQFKNYTFEYMLPFIMNIILYFILAEKRLFELFGVWKYLVI